MRMLFPKSVDDPDLHALYGQLWLERGGVRANFVTSLDGAATVDASSRGLQTPGDQQVFAVLRDLADVILVGRATAAAERYRALRPTPRRLRERARFGLPPQVPTAVVTASLDIDLAGALFDYAGGDARTVVITCDAAGADRIAAARAVADVVVCGAEQVDLDVALAHLRSRGLTRILSEGGPRLFASLVAADAVDELCLSVVPRLVGPGPERISAGAPWSHRPAAGRLLSLLEQDGTTFHRVSLRPDQSE